MGGRERLRQFDEGERVVRSAKDKAWDGMKAVVRRSRNARKINDWHEMQTPVLNNQFNHRRGIDISRCESRRRSRACRSSTISTRGHRTRSLSMASTSMAWRTTRRFRSTTRSRREIRKLPRFYIYTQNAAFDLLNKQVDKTEDAHPEGGPCLDFISEP